MTGFRPGEVVLVRFPFTDLRTTKLRPAVVVSSADFSFRFDDLVVLALTSHPQPERAARLTEWRAAGLPKPTWVKPVIGTLSCRLVKRSIGMVVVADERCIVEALRRAIAGKFRA
jgi:mRNA interferase MazF